jgi:REP element-mobilizing transposase RayT
VLEIQVGYWESFYHFIWTTKNREALLHGDIEPLIHRSIREVSEPLGVLVRAIGGTDDHIHIVVSIPPRVGIPAYIRELKTRTTHAVNRARLLPQHDTFSWQREYGMFTFGRQSLDDVVAYVKNQRQHHAEGTIRPYFETTDSREVPAVAPKERVQA